MKKDTLQSDYLDIKSGETSGTVNLNDSYTKQVAELFYECKLSKICPSGFGSLSQIYSKIVSVCPLYVFVNYTTHILALV